MVASAWRSVVSIALTCAAVSAAACAVLKAETSVVDKLTMAVVDSQEICLVVSEEILKEICQVRPTWCRSAPWPNFARDEIPGGCPHASHLH